MKPEVENKELLYPELSYEIIGAAFRVQNGLGLGLREVYYQRAFGVELEKKDWFFLGKRHTTYTINTKQ